MPCSASSRAAESEENDTRGMTGFGSVGAGLWWQRYVEGLARSCPHWWGSPLPPLRLSPSVTEGLSPDGMGRSSYRGKRSRISLLWGYEINPEKTFWREGKALGGEGKDERASAKGRDEEGINLQQPVREGK